MSNRRTTIRRRPNAETPAAPEAPPAPAPSAPEPTPEAAPPSPSDAKPPRRKRVLADLTPETPTPSAKASAKAAAPAEDRLKALEQLARGGDDLMASLFQDSGPVAVRLPEVGDRIQGTVVAVRSGEIVVDVGLKAEAWIDRSEAPDLTVGASIEAFVLHASELGLRLSTRLSGEAAADHLATAYEQDMPVDGLVQRRNKGGYEVDIGGIRAFCPLSQISRLPLNNPESPVGETLTFRILEMGDKTVVSARAHQELAIADLAAKRWATLSVGDVVDVVAVRVLEWGAFLDVDGVEGLLPRGQFSWNEVADLTHHMARGDRFRARVESIDPDARKLSFSLKDPTLDPWVDVHDKLQEGGVMPGKIVRNNEYGLFIQLIEGITGLLPRRYLDDGAYNPGDTMHVRVLEVDDRSRRVALVPPSVDPEAQAKNGAGTDVQGSVVEVRNNGVVVQLEDGRRAWLPANEAQLPPNTVLAQRFRRGHEVKARVRDVDPSRDRVTLTQKSDDNAEQRAWRQHLKTADRGSMGTLGDLLGGWKKR